MEFSPTPASRLYHNVVMPSYPVQQFAFNGQLAQLRSLKSLRANVDSFTEHVLKSSVSNPVLSSTGENARPPPNGTTGMAGLSRMSALPLRNSAFMTTAIKRPSPTPSVKRHKAEKLLKEHGSPPNVRVTAGGRIVPTDFTPLGSPRFPFAQTHRPYDRIQAPFGMQLPRHVSNPNAYQNVPAMPNGFVAYDNEGRLSQQVDGKWLPVPFGPSGALALFMPPPNWPFPAIGAPAHQPTATQPVGAINGAAYVVSLTPSSSCQPLPVLILHRVQLINLPWHHQFLLPH